MSTISEVEGINLVNDLRVTSCLRIIGGIVLIRAM